MKWARALRSGKYTQGMNRLKAVNGGEHHCCLGVLCELSGLGEWRTNVEFKGQFTEQAYACGTFDAETGILPCEVAAWAGMKTTDGRIVDGTTSAISLANLNDGKSSSSSPSSVPPPLNFDEIADIIETQYEYL